jgi:hypothetical protein
MDQKDIRTGIQDLSRHRQSLNTAKAFDENDVCLVVGEQVECAIEQNHEANGDTSPGAVAENHIGS